MPPKQTVRIDRRGLILDGKPLPLLAGAVHYWRNELRNWSKSLRAVRDLGFRIVDVYVPWSVHEIDKDRFDFGHENPQRDLAAFLRLADHEGLYAIVRPGPHINAEMTYFGLPERIVWRRGCQARGPDGSPVFLPVPPLGFPVPSHASNTFFKQASRFLRVVAELTSPLQYPHGPVVMVQVDNEGAFYFRDAAYDQDYHPDAIALYRRFLAKKYGKKATPRDIYGLGGASFHALEPPQRFEGTKLEELAYHLDWAEFQEHIIHRFFRRTAKRLRKSGLKRIPTSHNIPMAEHTTILGQGGVQRTVDVVGLDYYYLAGPKARRSISRRTSELALRGDVHDRPCFACELAAGYPPFMPPMSLQDNAFTVLCAMAYGLRGYNAYMAVERDRWIGAPIDAHGQPRASAQFWKSLNQAIESVDFSSLRRKMPVRIVTPRASIRMKRVLNAFGPATGAAFAVMGYPVRAHCLDDTFGTEHALASTTERFVDAVESALERKAIPFAHVGDDDPKACVQDAKWIVVATPAGTIDPALLQTLASFVGNGGRVSFGPNAPSRDPALRPVDCSPAFDASLLSADPSCIERTLDELDATLTLPHLPTEPDGVYSTLHEDGEGVARVVFVVQAKDEAAVAHVHLAGEGVAKDLLCGENFRWQDGVLTVDIPGRTVRMIGLTPT